MKREIKQCFKNALFSEFFLTRNNRLSRTKKSFPLCRLNIVEKAVCIIYYCLYLLLGGLARVEIELQPKNCSRQIAASRPTVSDAKLSRYRVLKALASSWQLLQPY